MLISGVLGLDNIDFVASTLDQARANTHGNVLSTSGPVADSKQPASGVRLKVGSSNVPSLRMIQQLHQQHQQLGRQVTLNMSQHDLNQIMQIISAGKRQRRLQ